MVLVVRRWVALDWGLAVSEAMVATFFFRDFMTS